MRIGIDANIAVRILVEDPSDVEQCIRVKQFLEDATTNRQRIFINLVVLCETIWVLSYTFKLPKETLIAGLEYFDSHPLFAFENPSRVKTAIAAFKQGNADFADYLIAQSNIKGRCTTTYTFDRKAAKQEGFTLLE